ncbi:hypothetical protein MN1_100 [Thermus phage MN1]|nr:hypothetical protein MN1_100 [Thermus phage MN1]
MAVGTANTSKPLPEVAGDFVIAIRDTAYSRDAVEATIKYMARHHYGLVVGDMGYFSPLYGPVKGGVPIQSAGARPNAAADMGRGGTIHGVLIVPPVDEPSWSSSSQGQAQPILFSPRPTSFSRRGGEFRLSLVSHPDTILTAQALSGANLPRGWIIRYLALLEALSTPVSVLGRKPWLALKIGGTWLGTGHFAFQLEGVSTKVEWMGEDVLSATVEMEFAEYLML